MGEEREVQTSECPPTRLGTLVLKLSICVTIPMETGSREAGMIVFEDQGSQEEGWAAALPHASDSQASLQEA